MQITRRKFVKEIAVGALGSAFAAGPLLSAPSVLTRRRTAPSTGAGELLFTPSYVQQGNGPHLLEWAYASDTRWDAFHSNITADRAGVRISDAEGQEKFAVNVRWNVEGFGYTFLTADNAGRFYELPAPGAHNELNLNYELAASRVARNRSRAARFRTQGWTPSREAEVRLSLSEEYLHDAEKAASDRERRGALAQQALFHALWASEIIELEKVGHDILRIGFRRDFYRGCNARAVIQMPPELFFQRFRELFDFATVTFAWKDPSAMGDFETELGKTDYTMRDLMVERLRSRGLTVEGRMITWFHKWVTPDFIRRMSYDQLRSYVEKHTLEMIHHYGSEMFGWELINEFHDWANEVQLNPEQIIEITRLACNVAKDAAPALERIVNNCCPYAEYVQLKEWSGGPAKYRQRTPWQFTRELVDAGVDFTVVGQQMYYPYRDLQDIMVYLERFEEFRKPFHIAELGAPGGRWSSSDQNGRKFTPPKEPYPWRRPWDEELQADWTEAMYTLADSKPFIKGCVWHDFVDLDAYIQNGGFLRTFKGEKKPAFDRLLALEGRWNSLPRTDHNAGQP